MNEHIKQELELEETITVEIDRGDKYANEVRIYATGFVCPVSLAEFLYDATSPEARG